MNYDAMTREQAIELLRLAMDTLQSLDSRLASEQHDALVIRSDETEPIDDTRARRPVVEPTP